MRDKDRTQPGEATWRRMRPEPWRERRAGTLMLHFQPQTWKGVHFGDFSPRAWGHLFGGCRTLTWSLRRRAEPGNCAHFLPAPVSLHPLQVSKGSWEVSSETPHFGGGTTVVKWNRPP